MSDASQIIDQYIAAWNRMDFDALGDLWDHEEPEIYYLAEEIEKPFTTLHDVDAYWKQTASVVDSVHLTATNRRFKNLGDDFCLVTYAMHMDAGLRGNGTHSGNKIGVDVQVSAILRRTTLRQTTDRWRFIHYTEAPLGPLPFMRKAYRSNYGKPD